MLGLTGVTAMALTVHMVTVVEPDTFVCESVSVAVIVISPVVVPAVTSPVESTFAISGFDEVHVKKDSKNVTPFDNTPVPVSWRVVPMAMPVSEGVIRISDK